MNTVWLLVVCISIVFAAINGRIDGFTKAMFEAGKAAVEVCLYLVGIVSLWLGNPSILPLMAANTTLIQTTRSHTVFIQPSLSCS